MPFGVSLKNKLLLGRGNGLVVSVVAFYYGDQSSNPADAYRFFL